MRVSASTCGLIVAFAALTAAAEHTEITASPGFPQQTLLWYVGGYSSPGCVGTLVALFGSNSGAGQACTNMEASASVYVGDAANRQIKIWDGSDCTGYYTLFTGSTPSGCYDGLDSFVSISVD